LRDVMEIMTNESSFAFQNEPRIGL
jgi:hypothetical protein